MENKYYNEGVVGICRYCLSPLYESKVEGYKFECLECDEDFYGFEQYDDDSLKRLWEEFGDVPIDYDRPDYPDGVIENDWYIFKAGTERMEIWHWFDKYHSKGVYALMFPNES